MKITNLAIAIYLVLFVSCSTNNQVKSIDPETYWGENPWPEIRKERINKL
ncbi:MAG: Xaa-Pro dipeptidase, partial [Roseivirga sp.]